MWPFHYLLPTVKFLSSTYKKARSPPPGRQLLLPPPRTPNSSCFCTAGWGTQHKRQILCQMSQHEGQPRGSSVLLHSLEVRMSQRAQPVAPLSTHVPLCAALCGAASHGFPLVLHSLPLCLCLTSTLRCGSPVPSPDYLSFLKLQQGLQLWLPVPGPSSVPCLVLHLTAYPSDFPASSFSSPRTGKLNSAASSVPPLLLAPCQPVSP